LEISNDRMLLIKHLYIESSQNTANN